MWSKFLMAAVLAGAVLVPTQAQPGPGGCPKDKGHEKQRMAQDLNLTQDQKDKLKAEREAGHQAREEIFAKMKDVRLAVKTELLKDKPDQTVLDGIAQKAADLHKQMMLQEYAHLLKVKEILKPDQFAKLMEHQGKMGPGREGGLRPDGKCPMDAKGDCKGMKKGCKGPGGMGEPSGDPL